MRLARFFLTMAILVGVGGTASAATVNNHPGIAGGKFEVTCKPHAVADLAMDPIVNPGAPSMHEHTFFGNKSVTETSTAATDQTDAAGTTCVLPNDTAAYWVPVACNGPCVDASGNPDMGMQGEAPIVNVVQPVKIFAYYFGTKGVSVGQYPTDLQLIGGDAHRTTPWPDKSEIEFHCGNGGSHSSPVRTYPYDCTSANGVRGTDGVVAVVLMPYCLETSGAVEYGGTDGSCPAGDTTLGQVQIHVHYGLDTSGFQTGSALNFSSGPYYTFHGDWQNGWDQTKLQSLVSGCLDINKDCGFLTPSNPGPGAKAAVLTPRAVSCTVAGKIPVISAQGFLSAHYGVNCTGDQSWTVDATVQALVSGAWQRAGNTVVSTVSSSGDATVTAPVESGQWSCTSGREYRTHAVLRNGNSDNSSSTTFC